MRPKMLGVCRNLKSSLRWPSDVPVSAKARFGKVSVGTEQNHASHTANPLASALMTGRTEGSYIPMISDGLTPGIDSGRLCVWSYVIALLKLTTKPPLLGLAVGAGVSVPNSCRLLGKNPSRGSHPGIK